MPSKLLKKLPLKQEIDHEIKLEQGAKTPALAPNCMASLELEEPQTMLSDLLDAAYICPSKSSFDAPILLKKSKDCFTNMHRL